MVQEIRTLGLPALVSFHTVATIGGISAAADQLGIAKSGVSRHVAQLENQLGVKLFERGARSVKLTPIGERLQHRVASVLAEIDLIQDIAREESTGISGQVNIAATHEFGGLVASRLFPIARERHPDLTLVMRTEYDFADLQDPGTDIAFRIGKVHDDRLIAREMGSFRRILVATPEVCAKYKLKHPKELADAPCMTFRGNRPGAIWEFESLTEETAVPVSGPLAVLSFHILLDIALAGLGFALIPEFMLGDSVTTGRLVRCLPDFQVRAHPVFLAYRPGARRIARIDATIKLSEDILPDILSREGMLE
ncbi:LysR family transcriptional regulator [Amylibacter sp. SFDW26]|uniref:LysR family transcriptional regulator n=1 Tax=Amylibacter sp. SFDW26 TaxID=2652722 RepID=UPI0012628B1A|nr:LysR family transcriptional regulator [Amylibacter sp. SFDW26]KAB7613489.1 LysR family transcriptional regulator [Amylibacter sp. SFDW26]